MVAGATRNADAIVAALHPRIVCSMSGAWILASIAGCAHANIRARRWSGMSLVAAAASSSSAIRRRWSAASAPLRRRRALSIALRRATVSSQASGLFGMPFTGQSTSAAAKASAKESSAAATSRVRDERYATSLP
jgi:hypothetical protein